MTDYDQNLVERLDAARRRKVEHRARVLAYYDDCPDGDPRKAQALQDLDRLGADIRDLEQQLDQAIG